MQRPWGREQLVCWRNDKPPVVTRVEGARAQAARDGWTEMQRAVQGTPWAKPLPQQPQWLSALSALHPGSPQLEWLWADLSGMPGTGAAAQPATAQRWSRVLSEVGGWHPRPAAPSPKHSISLKGAGPVSACLPPALQPGSGAGPTVESAWMNEGVPECRCPLTEAPGRNLGFGITLAP